MISLPALSVVDRGFEQKSAQTKDYENDICCFPATLLVHSIKEKEQRLDEMTESE